MRALPTLYIDSQSARCRRAMAWLDVSGENYHLKNVREDPAAGRALAKLSPNPTLPVLKWGDHLLQDFNRAQLVEFLWDRGVTLEDS